MDSATMNHYEKQLYTVFKTFDVDNTEALDRTAVHALCASLQLEDRGSVLVDTLFERRADRVTFAQFRNGLLTVLGAESGQSPSVAEREHSPSDEDSSGCELAPKFVFGSKKYGRRSRPQRSPDSQAPPRASSASRLCAERPRPARARRSVSAMETRAESGPNELHPERRIDRNEALALCRGLSMDGVDQIVERIFEEASAPDATVGEFFGRLNEALATTIEEARGDSGATIPLTVDSDQCHDEAEADVPVELVVEVWERVGVARPLALLLELGFDASTVRPPELELALDAELRAVAGPVPERCNFLAAALGVARLRAKLARSHANAAAAERDKLRGDVAEANARACLLAQEVDESHARIESELKERMRRVETKHAEAVRAAAAELAAERDRVAVAESRYRAEAERRAETESRARANVDELRTRLDEVETRATTAEARCALVERERERMAAEAHAGATLVIRNEGDVGTIEDSNELAGRLEELRRENQLLRDRVDELCAELEARASGMRAEEAKVASGAHDLSAELGSLLTTHRSEDSDSAPISLEQKVCYEPEIESQVQEGGAVCEACGRGGESGATFPKDAVDPATATESLRRDLLDAERRHHDEKQRLDGLVRELETSLEQMKSEYEKCEEYWAAKLEEERAMYSEEQRLGDERLAELIAKIGEYERQYAATLPPIDERRQLETQVNDLQDEFVRYRTDTDAELAARDAELQRLRDQLRTLERHARDTRDARRMRHADASDNTRVGSSASGPGSGGGGGEVRELRARTARAEAAVRRLHARLAAADLLVKDLYIENCHLATAKRL